MNNNYSKQNQNEMELVDLIWELLTQWKAVVLVCILTALLLPCAKLLMDTKAYDVAVAEKAEAEKVSSMLIDERIEEMIEIVPAEDAATIRYILEQQKVIDLNNEYLNNSIWVNTDALSQRSLIVRYYIKRAEDTDIQALKDAYVACAQRTKTINALRAVIAPDAPAESIYELIYINGGETANGDVGSIICTVTVVLPEETDADSVIEVIDNIINSTSNEIKDSVGPHSVSRLNVEDVHRYNTSVTDKRANVLYAINNMINNINAAKGRLSNDSLEVAEKILALKKASAEPEIAAETTEDDEVLAEPSFSKIYAILGFALGAFLYVFGYLMLRLCRKTLCSASSAGRFAGSRLLGEIYLPAAHKGFSWLISSNLVNKIRYRGKLNTEVQTDVVAGKIRALCSYHNTDTLPLLVSGVSESLNGIIEKIVDTCTADDNKIKLNLLDADIIEEKEFLDIRNAIYIFSNETKVDKLNELVTLCKEYDVQPLGAVYLEEV